MQIGRWNALALLCVLGAGALVVSFSGLRLGAGPGAEAESDLDRAWRAVRSRPQDPAAWLALGDAQALVDQGPAAEHAYRTAIQIAQDDPTDRGLAHARLGFLLYARGADAEARDLLTIARARGASVPLLDETLAALRSPAQGPPPAGAPPGPSRPSAAEARRIADGGVELDAATAPMIEAPPVRPASPAPAVSAPAASVAPPEVPLDAACAVPLERKRNGALLTFVEVNGFEVLLFVDTGATITLLNRSVAERAGVVFTGHWFKAHTANGVADFELGRIENLRLGDRTLQNVEVSVCDECIRIGTDGLLGLDVQARLDVFVDVVGGQLRFADCY